MTGTLDRLDRLAEVVHAKKVTPASVRVVSAPTVTSASAAGCPEATVTRPRSSGAACSAMSPSSETVAPD